MSQTADDRLYDLLPRLYRLRDVEQGQEVDQRWALFLQELLRIIADQVDVIDDDLAQLYDNWFIETCQDWVVPYIGELIGYRPAREAGEPGEVGTEEGSRRNQILFPRQDVANTIGNRRRRGTLSVLARQALDVTGWPSRAVEFYSLIGATQSLLFPDLPPDPRRGGLVDLGDGDALDRLEGAFEETAHTADTRGLTARSSRGRYNLPSIGLFAWRLRSYTVTLRQPYAQETEGRHCYTFSALGNDLNLFNRPKPLTPGADVDELQVPAPIRRRQFERRLPELYGEGKSVQLWWVPIEGVAPAARTPDLRRRELIPPERIIVADLTDWQYRTPRGKVSIDPVLGRIAFPPAAAELPRRGLWVNYSYGFPADLGGGEYPRRLSRPAGETHLYQVGERSPFRRIGQALERWYQDRPRHAVIELTDSGVYVEQVMVDLQERQTLELRAASGSAPVIRLLDWQTDQADSLTVNSEAGACFVLDGLLVTGRGMRVAGGLARLIIRHSTLVPGWALHPDCEPRRPAEPSLELENVDARVTIDHSIVGSVQVSHDEVRRDPIAIEIHDSVLDATGPRREALGAPGRPFAHAVLTVQRSTVFGEIQTHAIALGENSIFDGMVRVARRQFGCLRFCYVTPGSRTPRRFQCQPDLVVEPIEERFRRGQLSAAARDQDRERELLRVQPEYNSVRYGEPTYCQLSATCADEIRRGADDESEMGVYHDLFQPQREANLAGRLRDFTPAGVQTAIIFVT
jgi:hypothetical protein